MCVCVDASLFSHLSASITTLTSLCVNLVCILESGRSVADTAVYILGNISNTLDTLPATNVASSRDVSEKCPYYCRHCVLQVLTNVSDGFIIRHMHMVTHTLPHERTHARTPALTRIHKDTYTYKHSQITTVYHMTNDTINTTLYILLETR